LHFKTFDYKIINMKPDADPQTVKLTQYSKVAGCAAKIAPGILTQLLDSLPKNNDPALIVGTETADDAAVYKITEDKAIVQTIDFFPPVVDDPYTFGQIAAANALSDVYAMGGEPVTAMNVVAFPNCLGIKVLGEILRGGADKVHEAGASLVGGHSINDEEPKYGLSVTGLIDPHYIRKNYGARPGDVLILTKPIGTGLVNTAVKADMADAVSAAEAVNSMRTLNKAAKRVFDGFQIHACTDVTGFGLAGHSREMALASAVTIVYDFDAIPFISGAAKYAEQGLVPAGTYRNEDFIGSDIFFDAENETVRSLIFDPQTSGGLLVSVSPSEAPRILNELATYDKTGLGTKFAIIGHVREFDGKHIRITNCPAENAE
jgi:selenide,water dikinase